MFNLKTSGIIAVMAFILSFAIGLFNRTSLPMVIIRALLFSVLFFVVSGLVRILIGRFLPELLEGGAMEEDTSFIPGSRVNITEGDDYNQGVSAGYAQPAPRPAVQGAQPDDSDEGLGNISDLLVRGASGLGDGGGIDQNGIDGYNEEGGMEDFPAIPSAQSVSSFGGGGTAEIPGSEELLPDLESMAGAFSPSSGKTDSETTEYSVSTPAPKASSRNKAPAWSGDFNAKELAAGLRTVLNKEKEG